MKKVVVLGGGNGSSVVLEALKIVPNLSISAVISVSDSGGSSGVLRNNLHTLPPGDLLRAVLSLSAYDYKTLRAIFVKNRFSLLPKLDFGSGEPHNLGNILLTLLAQFEGDWIKAIRALEAAVEARGTVYPVSLIAPNLMAELGDSSVVRGEAAIDRPTYNRDLKIKRAWLEPEVPAFEGAIKTLQEADYIVISPGSMYTSLVPTLLPNGIASAIKKSKAKLIYITALSLEGKGETGPMKLSEFVEELSSYVPKPLDTVVYNAYQPTPEAMKKYNERGWFVYPKDVENVRCPDVRGFDYENPGDGYSAEKLSKVLLDILL